MKMFKDTTKIKYTKTEAEIAKTVAIRGAKLSFIKMLFESQAKTLIKNVAKAGFITYLEIEKSSFMFLDKTLTLKKHAVNWQANDPIAAP